MTTLGLPRVPLGLAGGTIELQEYDSAWPVAFEKIRAKLLEVIPGSRVEHIGSTSVVGSVSKPIIDISVGLPPQTLFHVNAARTAGLEFRLVRNGTAMFRIAGQDGRYIAHVHVRPLGSDAELGDLLFRDYLRGNESAVRRYSQEKRRILETAATRAEYSEAKHPLVEELVHSARLWARVTGWTPK